MLAFNVVDRSDRRIVSVFGDIDAMNADDFERVCSFSSDSSCVVVDLTACPYIDSTGLTALIKASHHGAVSIVLNRASRTYRIFAITDLLNYFTIVATMDEALGLRVADVPAQTLGRPVSQGVSF